MKLSQRLQQLAASLVQPDKPFEHGQIVVYKSLFIDAGENTWSRLMVIMPQPPQMERVSRMQGAYWSRDNQPAQRVCVGAYHHLGTDYGLADVDPRHIRLATEDEIKRGDALAYERALDNLKAHQHRQPLGNIAWMTQKEGHPIDSWHVRPVIVESTWAGGWMEFGGQLGENRSEVHMDRHGRELPNKRDDVNIMEQRTVATREEEDALLRSGILDTTGAPVDSLMLSDKHMGITRPKGYYEEQRQRRNQRSLEAYGVAPVTVGAKVSSDHRDQRYPFRNRPMTHDEFVLYAHAVASGLFDITDMEQVSTDRTILSHSEMPVHMEVTGDCQGVAANWILAYWCNDNGLAGQHLASKQLFTLPTESNKVLVIKYLQDHRIVGTLYIRSPSIQPGEKEPLSEAVKPLGLDDGDVVTGAYETINWESFNDRFARAITVKEELAIATEYATKLLSVPLITFPIQNEILVLSPKLSIINNSTYADETYVVIDRRDQLVATLVAESTTHKRYDIKVDGDINNVVIINVKDSRVISVNIYTK